VFYAVIEKLRGEPTKPAAHQPEPPAPAAH
jgi:hypothetical protein